MQLNDLIQTLTRSCEPIIKAIQGSKNLQTLGLRRSARLPVAAVLYHGLGKPILLITDRADRALTLLEELAIWLPDVPRMLFPEPTALFYEEAAWGDTIRRERLSVLTTLSSYLIPGAPQPKIPPFIITPARAVMTRTLPRHEFLRASRTLHRGQTIHPEDLARNCVSLGYEHTNIVIVPGQFARRGGILDMWPPAEPYPVRLEFFGDEIENIRSFDPTTQRTYKTSQSSSPERILVTPAREYLVKPEITAPPYGDTFSEFLIPILHPLPACLLDYLPDRALVLIDDHQNVEDTVTEVEEQAVLMRKDFIKEGTLPEEYPPPYLTFSEIQDFLSDHLTLELGGYIEEGKNPPPREKDEQVFVSSTLAERFKAGPRFGGRLKTVMEFVAERYLTGEHLILVSRQRARLEELWREQKLLGEENQPTFIENSLTEGWVFEPEYGKAIHLLTDGEIFGWRRPEPRRRAQPIAEAPEAIYADLEPNDYVVHVDHGIGRYLGLVRRTVDGVEHEYLCVEYADGAQLFVPIHHADRLTRYVGPDGRPPTLSRLGTTEWRSVKSHVKEAVREVAEDLLELYAQRSIAQGFAFSPDNTWQKELEASFPYIETEDQLRVLEEVKLDMQTPRPMDRLICGDVGYGKTEVALRAAFKAVLDNCQVAILVPTTVLAQQHFNTFTQRLSAFPVEVEMLSRFRTPLQQRDILDRLAQGKIDIIIGTHRLLSSDVSFKNLGLLIIDEEQRFGVTHKEALKKMRTEVDVLTLTATPIPRTLYMALSGVRDISTIQTPPEERLPIVTHVGPYSPRLVRYAILRELERGGQVFFVHNRVQTIEAMYAHLKRLVPEARIAIAHGQMPEQELSQRMQQFTEGQMDILLTTSIIESGLDIPNANTLIVDRADTFGLAQLYQLRGRVGRGAQRAYAYFFRHNRILPTPEGRQRLETIAENAQLGAGFSIAMRDLEIRGAGELLGTRQHGHIAAVGFHLYTYLLAEAVKRLRAERNLPPISTPLTFGVQPSWVNVELPLHASIPADYIPDASVRLGLYRRMADTRNFEELDALAEEFKDRFGPLPEPVQNLFIQLKVKLLAEGADLTSVHIENGQIAMRFPDGGVPSSLPNLGPYVRVGKSALWMPFQDLPEWREELLDVLHKLSDLKRSQNRV